MLRHVWVISGNTERCILTKKDNVRMLVVCGTAVKNSKAVFVTNGSTHVHVFLNDMLTKNITLSSSTALKDSLHTPNCQIKTSNTYKVQ